MTEPVITINGRQLTEPQARVVRLVLTSFGGLADKVDRIAEVMAMVDSPARLAAAKALVRTPKIDRILQLAGIVPEKATTQQLTLAHGYAAADLPIDEAAVRLQKAIL